MSQVRLADQAKSDLLDIWRYIGVVDNRPETAYRQVETLHEKFTLLATQPLMGQSREDLRPNLRTFSAGSYVILYYPVDNGIHVLGVVHGSQDIEGLFRREER